MKRYRQVAAFILAGGASSRMGQDKGLLNFGGVPLIVHTARLIKPLVNSVTVVGPSRHYATLGLRQIADERAPEEGSKGKGRGPLAGVATALADTQSPWNLILACDLPHLTKAWIDWLLSRAVRSQAQVVIPRTGRGLEPLAAMYRRECGAIIADALARGLRKVTDGITGLRLEPLDPREWQNLDPSGLILTNMNTHEDYNEALKAGIGRAGAVKEIKKTQKARQRKP